MTSLHVIRSYVADGKSEGEDENGKEDMMIIQKRAAN